MALHVCDLFYSQWGIGITGYAAPVPESDNKLYAYYAIAHNNRIMSTRKVIVKKGESVEVQLFYVNETLSDLARCINELVNSHE